jgi:hypothetical protein
MVKSYDLDEKTEIVLRAIKGENISDLVDEYGVPSISGKMSS